MQTKSPTEPGHPLVLRIVGGIYRSRIHLCLADPRLANGAIVTLQALCTDWAYDVLSHIPIEDWVWTFPEATMCPACWVRRKNGTA